MVDNCSPMCRTLGQLVNGAPWHRAGSFASADSALISVAGELCFVAGPDELVSTFSSMETPSTSVRSDSDATNSAQQKSDPSNFAASANYNPLDFSTNIRSTPV